MYSFQVQFLRLTIPSFRARRVAFWIIAVAFIAGTANSEEPCPVEWVQWSDEPQSISSAIAVTSSGDVITTFEAESSPFTSSVMK
jgi:hypothetical protein